MGNITTTSKEIELAWAAGFFDGEGTMSYVKIKGRQGRRDYGNPFLTVVQVELSPLQRFKQAVDIDGYVSYIYGPYDKRLENNSPVYMFRAAGKNAVAIYNNIRPYLCEPKRKQGDLVLKKWAYQKLTRTKVRDKLGRFARNH